VGGEGVGMGTRTTGTVRDGDELLSPCSFLPQMQYTQFLTALLTHKLKLSTPV